MESMINRWEIEREDTLTAKVRKLNQNARQALNDTVEILEKELKEAQLKEAHRKKTGVVILLLNLQINHKI